MNKVRILLSYDWKMKELFLEAFFFLGLARMLKSIPFVKVAPLLGKQMDETTFALDESNLRVIRNVSFAVKKMSRYTLWESMCLVQAIAAMKMLEKRKIESTIYLGTAKDETGRLLAHAWLRSGPMYITGKEGMEKFTVISTFAKRISIKGNEGE